MPAQVLQGRAFELVDGIDLDDVLLIVEVERRGEARHGYNDEKYRAYDGRGVVPEPVPHLLGGRALDESSFFSSCHAALTPSSTCTVFFLRFLPTYWDFMRGST